MEDIFSLGYGNLDIETFVEILKRFNIKYLLDVRSKPYSNYNPDFSKAYLSKYLKKSQIKYVFLGDKLGGLPDEPHYRDISGKIDYSKFEKRPDFLNAINRIIRNLRNGIRLCLMCVEFKPENCHRSKLIGESLFKHNINVQHILRDGTLVIHKQLRDKFIPGQYEIFGHQLKSTKKNKKVNNSKEKSTIKKIFTIGVYGQTEDKFFNNLIKYNIDTFCDVRNRRGMRGTRYKFVNSKYLQKKLNELGIQYFHFKSLSPSKEIRQIQDEVDRKNKTLKSNRIMLSSLFIDLYKANCLADDNIDKFVDSLMNNAEIIVLFCVEKEPTACHRSLLANALADKYNFVVENIIP